ncbi:Mediator of RNA polymerase II transcription subunit 7 [Smittium culicis]|uniref:Mediator of RNA polymerase II transcription subunit 7 n=1 Tax=Smittium culicis TaxID=133412 RepID=A0A1R1XXH5_9FUNG|nr:Mediator of RNA polymerase II transcription subunit 7 [Smittium culicis]
MTDNQNISTAFPFPPAHYKHFTQENINLVKSDSFHSSEKLNILTYLSPPAPPTSDEYAIFGRTWSKTVKNYSRSFILQSKSI